MLASERDASRRNTCRRDTRQYRERERVGCETNRWERLDLVVHKGRLGSLVVRSRSSGGLGIRELGVIKCRRVDLGSEESDGYGEGLLELYRENRCLS